jgi:hypothetical protein
MTPSSGKLFGKCYLIDITFLAAAQGKSGGIRNAPDVMAVGRRTRQHHEGRPKAALAPMGQGCGGYVVRLIFTGTVSAVGAVVGPRRISPK